MRHYWKFQQVVGESLREVTIVNTCSGDLAFVAMWMELETVILSEVSHTEEEEYHMI